MTQTKESWYKSTLAKLLEPADTTMEVATAPTVTKGRLYLTNWQQEEWIQFSWVSGTTLQNLTRWLSKTADPATAWTWLTWIAWTVVKLVVMHDQLVDKLEWDQIIMEAKVYATTAARDSALWGDWAATKAYTGIYVTATGLHYNYNLSTNQWESVDTWTTTPNSSETVAWIKEDATQAEFNAGTKVGWTGANLSVTPDVIQAGIQSGSALYFWASAVGTDAYAVTATPTVTTLTTWMRFWILADVANTWACTLTVDATATKNIKTLDWNDPQSWAVRIWMNEFVYDWTNFVLQSEDFATTTNKWIQENATDAEAYARSATDKTITASNLAAVQSFAILQTTRVYWTASWDVDIAHWLPQIPKRVEIRWSYVTAWWRFCSGYWYSNGTNDYCSYIVERWDDNVWIWYAAEAWNDSSNAIYTAVWEASWAWWDEERQVATVSFDATNVTLSWVRSLPYTNTIWTTPTVYITMFAHT